MPNYKVRLKQNEGAMNVAMVVDCGADFSVISLKAGQDFGYALGDGKEILVEKEIAGKFEYVLRRLEMTINGYSFIAPVAWLQDNGGGDQLLLGRDVVFDKFNIEFRQADEEIIFTWRG